MQKLADLDETEDLNNELKAQVDKLESQLLQFQPRTSRSSFDQDSGRCSQRICCQSLYCSALPTPNPCWLRTLCSCRINDPSNLPSSSLPLLPLAFFILNPQCSWPLLFSRSQHIYALYSLICGRTVTSQNPDGDSIEPVATSPASNQKIQSRKARQQMRESEMSRVCACTPLIDFKSTLLRNLTYVVADFQRDTD